MAGAEEIPAAVVRGESLARILTHPSALQWLRDHDGVRRLLDYPSHEEEQNGRYKYLFTVLTNNAALEAMASADTLDAMLALVEKQKDKTKRRQLRFAFYSQPASVKQMVESDRLEELLDFIATERNESQRRSIIRRVVSDDDVRGTLIDKGHTTSLLQLIRLETNQYYRGSLVSNLFSSDAIMTRIVKSGGAPDLLEYIRTESNSDLRRRVLQAVVARLAPLVKAGHLPDLIPIIRQESNAQTRGSLLATAVTSTEALRKTSADELLGLTESLDNAFARRAFLAKMFGNAAALTLLLDAGHYDKLSELARSEKDHATRMSLWTSFYAHERVISRMLKDEQAAELVAIVDDMPEDARYSFLVRLFTNDATMKPLVSQVAFAKLVQLARSIVKVDYRTQVLGALVGSPAITARLMADQQTSKLLDVIAEEKEEETQRQMLTRVIQRYEVVDGLLEQGHREQLVTLTAKDSKPASRGELLARLLTRPLAIEQLVSQDRLRSVLQAADEDEDAAFRRAYLQQLLASSDLAKALREARLLDTLFRLVAQESDPKARAELFGHIASNSTLVAGLVNARQFDELVQISRQLDASDTKNRFLQKLVAIYSNPGALELLQNEKRLGDLIDLARTQSDSASRAVVLQGIVRNTSVLRLLLKDGHFEDLWELASTIEDPADRGTIAGTLAVRHLAQQPLTGEPNLERMLRFAGKLDASRGRSSFLGIVLASSPAVTKLVEHEHFDSIQQLIESVEDDQEQLKLQSYLLVTEAAIEQLVAAKTLKDTYDKVVGGADESTKRSLFGRVFSQTPIVSALIQHGLYQELEEVSRKDDAESQWRVRFLINPEVLVKLAETRQVDLVFTAIEQQPETSRFYSLLVVLEHPASLQAVLDADLTGKLLQAIRDEANDSYRSQLRDRLLTTAARLQPFPHEVLVELMADAKRDATLRRRLASLLVTSSAVGPRVVGEQKLGAQLLDLIRDETDAASRAQQLTTALNSRPLWQALISSGQVDVVWSLLALEPDDHKRRELTHRILTAPTGLVPHLILQGKLSEAAELLEENAVDDVGRLQLAAFLQLTGGATDRLSRAETDDELRLQTYLLRVGGDLESALLAAEKTNDTGLISAILVELHRWRDAAKLQQKDACPPPIPFPANSRNSTTHPQHARAEQLSLLAAYHRLAGNQDGFQATLSELQQLAESEAADSDVRWFCVEALMINRQTERGMQMLESLFPERAANLYITRRQFDKAFELFHWREEVSRVWFDSLPGNSILDKFGNAITVATTLDRLGHREQAAEIVEMLQSIAAEQPLGNSTSSPGRQCWVRLSVAFVRLGRLEDAWRAAAKSQFNADSTPGTISPLYGRRAREAYGLFRLFRTVYPDDSATAALSRLHHVMHPSAEPSKEQLQSLVDDLGKLSTGTSAAQRASFHAAVGDICRGRGKLKLALPCYESAYRLDDTLNSNTTHVAYCYADVLYETQQFERAAAIYETTWQRDHEQLLALYLSGTALLQTDDGKQEGERRRQLAHQMALESNARRQLASGLAERGFHDEARQQYESILRMAAPGHWEWNDAAQHLGDYLIAVDLPAAILWREHALLDDLRTNFYLRNDNDLLTLPNSVAVLDAQAAIAAGDFEQVQAVVTAALESLPANVVLAEELVPLLDAAQQAAAANALFDSVYTYHSKLLKQHPDSAMLHNDIAWLAARCDRRLDASLAHAEFAVSNFPHNASYQDTLAEVHHKLGNREKALEHSRRAIQLDPRNPTLQANHQRRLKAE